MSTFALKKEDIPVLQHKKLYLFDMDGTLYKDGELFDGVIELLDAIKQNGGRYVFLTNNSSKSVDKYIEKLKAMGIPANYDEFFTSTQATIFYLKNMLHYNGECIYAMGTQFFVAELKQAGFNVVTEVTDEVKIVLVGYDTELHYQKLMDVSYLLTKDVIFLATNPDLVCPTSFGFVPDCGSMCEMLYNATKKKPKYIGKPNADMIQIVLDKMHVSKEEALVVGDRLYTDIASGNNAGVDTVCVLTGETQEDDLASSTYKPTYVLDSVKELLKTFQ